MVKGMPVPRYITSTFQEGSSCPRAQAVGRVQVRFELRPVPKVSMDIFNFKLEPLDPLNLQLEVASGSPGGPAHCR
jgi:hypothetical protein